MKHLKKLLCGLLAAALMLCALPAAALAEGAPAQPTRTERLEITAETPLTDELDTEGWKWEPSGNGGTLTLQNCYIQVNSSGASSTSSAIYFGNGVKNATIHLEGSNTLETTNDNNVYLISTDADVTFTGGEDASLNFVVPGSVMESSYLFGIFANSLAIKSGNITCNTAFCFVNYGLSIEGGSLTVDAGHMAGSDGIYSCAGNVNISGGTVNIHAGRDGIFIPGNGAFESGEQTVNITGGDVTIKADNPGEGARGDGIYAKNVIIDTNGKVTVYGSDVAIDLPKENGKADILNMGKGSSISVADTSTYGVFRVKYPDNTSVTIAPADYSAVDAAEAQAKALNAEDYKDFSAVTAALAAVDRGKNLLQQSEVDAMAQAILDAVAGLEKKPAPTPTPAPQAPAADAGRKANPKTGVAK